MFNNITRMVNKMKLKLFIFSTFLSLFATNVIASDNVGLRTIVANGKIKCGADISAKAYAVRDSDGIWRGYAVDWCKVFAKAMLNKSDAFEMVDVNEENMKRAFSQGKIDVMIGAPAPRASNDYKSGIVTSNLVVYDKQGVLVRKKEGAKEIEDYKGERLCVVNGSADFYNIQKYINMYDLNITILPSRDINQARESFMLKRCSMITANKSYLISLHQNLLGKEDMFEILPEQIAPKPLYVYVKNSNNKLRVITKWVINAMQLAEENNINSQNIGIYIGVQDQSIQNLLGDDEKLWKSYDLPNAKWAREAIAEFGNFGEIYERNFGKESEFKFDREDNRMFIKGGLIIPQPFL